MHAAPGLVALALIGLAAVPVVLAAQDGVVPAAAAARPRPAAGRREIAAVASPSPIRLDGALDEDLWRLAVPATDFVQSEPDEGSPATERTEVRVAYDADYLYIAAYLYDSRPDLLVVSDIRKDFRTDNQDTFEVILDTFADRRNGYVFATNPAGARADQQVTNEGRETNTSWDAPWSVRTRRVQDGWTAEMAIPLRAIRASATAEAWGINFSRRIRRKNEVVFWAPIPRAYALTRLSLAGDLVGLPGGARARDLRLTPYVLGRNVRDAGAAGYDQRADAGADAKLGLSRGLTLDLTANPDFAQAETDEQQVNLTQFSQFFPEKRDFFLENSGQFYVGDTPRNRRLALQPTGEDNLLLFFSRRMGLAGDGRPIGIDGGARLTGRAAGLQVGALALRTRDLDSVLGSDYAVVRVRRNLFASSDVGALFMTRSTVRDRGDYNRIYGVDGTFRLPGQVDWNTFAVNTETDGVSGERFAFQTSLNHEGNFFHGKTGLLSIADGFNDELGFVRRMGVRDWMLDTGVRPRFPALRRRGIREMHPHVVWDYFTDQSGNAVAKRLHNGYSFFFNNGGFVELAFNPRGETLKAPLQLDATVQPIPVGRYDWNEWQLRLETDPSRTVTLIVNGITGGLWNGTQRTANVSVTVRPSYRLRATVGLQRTAADLAGPGETFVREIWTLRANYSFTTNMFVDALAQYDAARELVSTNVRFSLIHHPLSNLFVVYNEQRSTVDGAPAAGRSVIVKVTQMVAM